MRPFSHQRFGNGCTGEEIINKFEDLKIESTSKGLNYQKTGVELVETLIIQYPSTSSGCKLYFSEQTQGLKTLFITSNLSRKNINYDFKTSYYLINIYCFATF